MTQDLIETGVIRLGGVGGESATDEDDLILARLTIRPPSPCNVEFVNANIIVAGKSSMRKNTPSRSNRSMASGQGFMSSLLLTNCRVRNHSYGTALKRPFPLGRLSFNDAATETFEYPSEKSLLDDHLVELLVTTTRGVHVNGGDAGSTISSAMDARDGGDASSKTSQKTFPGAVATGSGQLELYFSGIDNCNNVCGGAELDLYLRLGVDQTCCT
ncbi:unnamed protein product [Notodromas monacha]|uniref:Uncharacterized protein n=1 Tax=Notodromas monacha TaxID=399045 RepID=A0A7R9BZP8_9CRUS|nr:unnamed protein product [Notodromas monacha]CAG0923068.1 unnamed protein product [Notodromas monacha]